MLNISLYKKLKYIIINGGGVGLNIPFSFFSLLITGKCVYNKKNIFVIFDTILVGHMC